MNGPNTKGVTNRDVLGNLMKNSLFLSFTDLNVWRLQLRLNTVGVCNCFFARSLCDVPSSLFFERKVV